MTSPVPLRENYSDGGAVPSPTTVTALDMNSISGAVNNVSTVGYNVLDYGAVGNGTHDDTTAIQAALDACAAAHAGGSMNVGGVVYLPPGVYKISSALQPGHYTTIRGAGSGSHFGTVWTGGSAPLSATRIVQTSTTANGIQSVDKFNVHIENLFLQGPASGSGDGISATWSFNQNLLNHSMKDLWIDSFGHNGITMQTMLASTFDNVYCMNNGNDGWYIYGGGTTCTFNSCAGSGNGAWGFHMDHQNYSTWNACGADGNHDGWLFANGVTSCAVNGCGTENNTNDGLVTDNIFSIIVNGFLVEGNKHYGIWCKAASAFSHVILNNIWETAGTGAVYSIFQDLIASIWLTGAKVVSPIHDTGNLTSAADLNSMKIAGWTVARFVQGYIPSTPTSAGSQGEFAYDGTYVYLCPVNGTWVRIGAAIQSAFTSPPNLAPLDATINDQTGTTYTLVVSDDGKVVRLNNGSAITLTVPQDSTAAIPVGAYIELVQLGAGQVTVAAGTGATVNSRGGALKIAGQYGVAGLRKTAANTFVLAGDITT